MNIDRYNEMFREAEQQVEYWQTVPAMEFAEEVARRMREHRINRAELARRLGVSRPAVTKMLRGDVNFKLSTMVRVAMALRGVLHTHISDRNAHTRWLDEYYGSGVGALKGSTESILTMMRSGPMPAAAANEEVVVG